MAKQIQGLTAYLAEQGLAFQYAALPESVREIARHTLLDGFSVLLAGWSDPAVQLLRAELLEQGSQPAATLWGSGERLGLSDAALLNGMASHVLDFDDAHLASRVHPSVVLWPALLAAGEAQDSTGSELLTAFVSGVEIQAQIAALLGPTHYQQGWHSTATLGSFGATVAAGRLYGLEPSSLCQALGIAATLTGGLRASFGTPCKPLHAGRAAANGLMAARLARRGFGAVEDIFERPEGFLAVLSGQKAPLPPYGPELQACASTQQILFKYHASCYGTQAPIEAALALRHALSKNALTLAAISEVQIAVEPQYLSVCNIAEPQNAMEARFSLRHMLALALAGWSTVDERSFSPVALQDTQLKALRQSITVNADPQLARAQAQLSAQVNGNRLSFSVNASRPATKLPEQRRRLCDKSSHLLAAYLTEQRIQEVQALLLSIDQFDSLRQWTQQLSHLLQSARFAEPALTPLAGYPSP